MQIEVAASECRAEDVRFIRLDKVMRRTGLAHPTIYRMAADGNFPGPIKIGAKATAWLAHEVDGWIQGRIAASRQKAAA